VRRPLAAALLASAWAACSGSGDVCGEDQAKAEILAIAEDWYLYPDLLPAVPLPDLSGQDPQAFLDGLTATARAQGEDRGWSYLMADAQFQQFYSQGQAIGFGFSLLEEGAPPTAQVLVKQIFAGSAAAAAGFARGDQILAAGPDPASLTLVAGLTGDQASALISAGGEAGVSRSFRVLPLGASEPVVRTMTSAAYDLDPVPSHWEQGSTGYVQLRTFIAPAEDALRAAFADFGSQGVKDVVVDLRYNGGGLLDTAEVLADLLAGKGLAEQKMYDQDYNSAHAAQDGHRPFAPDSSGAGGSFERIAFVTTAASASASELVPNAIDAYRTASTLAYVGATTYGKPVGQIIFPLAGCDTELFLVAFRLVNAAGNTDYYDGLPDAQSNAGLCAAADDLQHPQDSVEEASTAAAVYFVENGSCPPAAAVGAPELWPPADQLLARTPTTPEEREMPGTF